MQLLLDIGSHKGETIEIFLKNFNIKNIYSFEASASNYAILKNNVTKIKKKYINVAILVAIDDKRFYNNYSLIIKSINNDSLINIQDIILLINIILNNKRF